MAETVHPRLNSASASTSSPTENMAGGSSCWSAWTPPASRGPPPEWRTLQGARRPAQGVGNFGDRGWGISVIRSSSTELVTNWATCGWRRSRICPPVPYEVTTALIGEPSGSVRCGQIDIPHGHIHFGEADGDGTFECIDALLVGSTDKSDGTRCHELTPTR